MKQRDGPRTIAFDTENSPVYGAAWGYYQTDLLWIEHDWHFTSICVKRVGRRTITKTLPDFSLYKRDKHDDRALVKWLHKEMSWARIIIAHNGNAHDIKKANARFIFHKLRPLIPGEDYVPIDTLIEARKISKFTSNKLDVICETLGIGRKLPHPGKEMWRGCEQGDMRMWRIMKKYNHNDVDGLLWPLYQWLMPYMKKHPDMRLHGTKPINPLQCPRCLSLKTQKRGSRRTNREIVRLIFCWNCHHSSPYERVKIKP